MTIDKKVKEIPNTIKHKPKSPVKVKNLNPIRLFEDAGKVLSSSISSKTNLLRLVEGNVSKLNRTRYKVRSRNRSKSFESDKDDDLQKLLTFSTPSSPIHSPISPQMMMSTTEDDLLNCDVDSIQSDSDDKDNKDSTDGKTTNSEPVSKVNLIITKPPVPISPLDAFKRSNSFAENKYKVNITSERLAKLRELVDQAVREHKVFSIKGGWGVIRRELLRRNWIEKYDRHRPASVTPINNNNNNNDDLTSNLPKKQDWESPAAYQEKCERTIMSRMLQTHDVDFYYFCHKDHNDLMHRSNTYKIMSRFGKSLFASKEGLALLLQQAYWYTEPGVSAINFPRCYVLGFPDHFAMFVEDFRLTACISLLKWVLTNFDASDKLAIEGPDGDIPISTLKFALSRCKEFIESKKHVDLDKNYDKVWDHEWDTFITNYYRIIHEHKKFIKTQDYSMPTLYAKSKSTFDELNKYWPEMCIDGIKNIWILKPGNKCRGRGIQLIKSIGAVERIMAMKLKYVVQKYIERPLLIYKTKFDIRQWFLVSSVQPLIIWMYRECYLRFSTQIFNLENFHESLHLTNHAIQCKYTNVQDRSKSLPKDNMWDCHTFRTYLGQLGFKDKWSQVIYPGMRESITCAMLASQDVMDRRPNTFELYGADFMISEDFKPWLLEINCCPDLSCNTSVTRRLCPRCLEDVIKVIIDKRRDPQADTGLFDCIYRQFLPRIPPYLGMNLSVRGKRLYRHKINNKRKEESKRDLPLAQELDAPPSLPFFRKDLPKRNLKISVSQLRNQLPTPAPTGNYGGPVIEDFMADVQSTKDSPQLGVQYVPPTGAKILNSLSGKRVSSHKKCCKSIIKTNNNSVFRRLNRGIKENNKTVMEKKCYSGVFNEWSLKINRNVDNAKTLAWDRENSILKSKSTL